MPRAPKKCGKPGCETRVTATTYCTTHSTGWKYGGTPRTSTPEHRAWRKAVLDRDHWRCQLKLDGCKGKANEAHHLIADADGGALTLTNGVAACKPCHATVTALHANRKRWGHTN